MADNIDTNVQSYSLAELLAIAGVNQVTPAEIKKNTNAYIQKYRQKNPKLAHFFEDVQMQLLHYAEGLMAKNNEDSNESGDDEDIIDINYDEDQDPSKIYVESFTNRKNEAIYPAGETQVTNWFENESLKQKDKNQENKITSRVNKIKVFGNQHDPAKQEQIATTDTYQLPVKQDSLNPNLKNTVSRFVNLDSQFRQYTSVSDSSATSYTCDLSDTLKDVLSMRLYSYQIPYSWYTIDTDYGNTCLWIVEGEYAVPVSVPPGNYTNATFQTQLNTSFVEAGFTFATPPVSINNQNGKVTMNLYGGTYTSPNPFIPDFTITTSTVIMFYDFSNKLYCANSCLSKTNHFFNGSLGWLMGYRLPYINVLQSGNIGTSIIDLNGTKYLILVVDDYNQNHINNSLVSISQFSNTLKVPSYYSPDLPQTCATPEQVGNNLQELVNGTIVNSVFNNQLTSIDGLLIGGKYNGDYSTNQIVLPSAPRTLTQAQIYTINEINNNNNNVTNYLSKAPTSSDILGVVPVKTSTGVPTGSLLVEFGGTLQENIRTYFGPVNIERLCVKLLNDKGNVLNLNGSDWCFTLVCDCLYQY